MYVCKLCEKTFIYKSRYERHISNKLVCFDNQITQKAQKGAKRRKKAQFCEKKNELETSEDFENIDENKKKCEYCCKILSIKSINRHIIHTCKKVPKNVKEFHIIKFNQHGNTKIDKKIDLEIFRTSNQINNANLISIKDLTDFNKDDYSHLTKEDMIKICKSGYKSYKTLVDLLARNKNNINFMIKNSNKDDVYVIRNQKVDIISRHEFKEGKLDRLLDILGDIVLKEEIIENISEHNKKVVEDVLDMDKMKQSVKYNEYSNEVYRSIQKYNNRNKVVLKKLITK